MMNISQFSQIEYVYYWTFLLLPLPLLVKYIIPAAKSSNMSLKVPFYQHLAPQLGTPKINQSFFKLFFAIIAWLLLILAAARPQLIGDTIQQSISGRSLMMAVDISGSMQIKDMQIASRRVTRLTAVKAVASRFIKKRKGDRIGLILFGSRAYLQTPLTFDRKTVNTFLEEAELGLAGRETAIGDAIGLAVKRLRKEPENNRVLILLTDGANTAGKVDPLKAADLAAQEKIKIYTIGIGADEYTVQTPFGPQQVAGNDLDEKSLITIAEKTHGRYFRARDLQSLLNIYAELDNIEPVSKDSISYRPVKELYYYPLAGALLISVFLVLMQLLSSLRLTSLRSQTTSSDTGRAKT